jgi:glycosyltransferase involved in cell wall biosynthesis
MVEKAPFDLMVEKKQFIVSHPTGNTFVHALISELYKNDLLSMFFTTIGVGNTSNLVLRKLLERRNYSIPDSKISRHWKTEFYRLCSGGDQNKKRALADKSYKELDRKVASCLNNQKVDIVHAYEDGALETFRKAKESGMQCSYELPIAYWKICRLLLREEAERYPEWSSTLETLNESEEKLYRKEQELIAADKVFCPSQFVMDSIPLEIRQKTPCQISPFGSPPCEPIVFKRPKKNDTLKLFFVGSMSQRKGLADLFEAIKLLKGEPISLSILGQPSMPMEFYRKQSPDFEYFPPCSNQKVREIMHQHDALVLPSIVEGRALVQQEALSCGLPIVVTPNAGGEDLVEEGITGHLVPIRSPEKIAESICSMMANKKDKDEIEKLCQKKAREYTWEKYAQNIIDFNLSNHVQRLEIA